jgi:hypothetical protein
MTAMTEKIIVTWASSDDQINHGLVQSRQEKISSMISAGKTDGTMLALTETVSERYFVDAESAQEYGNWLVSTTTELGIPSPTFTTSPI